MKVVSPTKVYFPDRNSIHDLATGASTWTGSVVPPAGSLTVAAPAGVGRLVSRDGARVLVESGS